MLRRRDGWWGGESFLDEVVYVDLGDDPSATVGAIASQQVHGQYSGDADINTLDILKSLPHVNIQEVITAGTAVARVQMDRDEYKDPRIARAMRLAVDTPRCLELGYRNIGSPGEHHHVCPVHPDYKKLPFMNRDVEAAKKLLAEAGHPNGIDLEIASKKEPAWELQAVQAMVEQWKDAGIRVNINVMPSAQFWDVWAKVPFGFTSWAHRPLGFMVLALAYRSGVPWNESHFSDAEFDTLLTKAEGTPRHRRADRDRRPAPNHHAGARSDHPAAMAWTVRRVRQASAGLQDPPHGIHLSRRDGLAGLSRSARTRLPIAAARSGGGILHNDR